MAASRPRRIVLAVHPGCEILDCSGPVSAFHASDRLARIRGQVGYRVELVAPQAGPCTTSSGIALVAERSLSQVRGPVDTLNVPGGTADAPDQLVRFVRRLAPHARRVASVCTGAFTLAEAGLLDGRRATTHWAAAEHFRERFPAVRLEPDAIWVEDDGCFSSAGVTAGIDLALALVDADLGREIALEAARYLVMYLKRPGGQSQFSVGLRAQAAGRTDLADLPAFIAEHLADDLSVPTLARRAAMSPRHFSRAFGRAFGVSPARYVERARVESACAHLELGRLGVEEIALRCGFGHAERMRRAFHRVLRVAPSDYRSRFSAERIAS